MSLIDDINNNNKIEYYVSCIIPLISSALNKKCVPIYVNLLANESMEAVPNYAKSLEKQEYLSNVRFSQMLSRHNISTFLGIEVNFRQFDSFEKGIKYINVELSNGFDVVVGVTSYHLPYSPSYHSMKYLKGFQNPLLGISNHFISIVESANNCVRVFDTTPKILDEWISFEDFNLAWLGDSKVPEISEVPDIDSLSSLYIL